MKFPVSIAPLPLDEAWPELSRALESHPNLVLVAEPGAGKTTRFPPRLLSSGLIPDHLKILLLEPRRLAARASAARIADEQGWRLGQEIGYQVRFENRTSKSTRLDVLTEGLLARRLLSTTAPDLADVGAVILDEFHERSQHTDLAIGLLSELQQLARPDLRLIVMSATLDAERVSKFLGDAPIVRVPGRTYPVTVTHIAQPLMLDTGPALADRVAKAIFDVIDDRTHDAGDILVFLPGTREIRYVRERVEARLTLSHYECRELHGSLSLDDQNRTLRRDPEIRRVILATNIAETSLTIEGVGTVIDSGLARTLRTDAAGFPRLQISRISLASATQRAGRAGRLGPGRALRLWNKNDEASMAAFEQPEILRCDLTDPLMTLLAQGVNDPAHFTWFESPPPSALTNALTTLTDLGFRDFKTGRLTASGVDALKLPLPVRPARLLLAANQFGLRKLGARLAALMTEKDIGPRAPSGGRGSVLESDPVLRLHLLENRGANVDRHALQNVLRVSEALEQACTRLPSARPETLPAWARANDVDEQAMRLLLLGYPDRVAKRRRPREPAARMVGRRGITLAPFSSVESADLFVAIDSMEPRTGPGGSGKGDALISVASSIQREWLEEFFKTEMSIQTQMVFDDENGQVLKQTAFSFRDLPIEEPKSSRPQPDEAFPILIDACLERWDTLFAPRPEIESLRRRLEFLRTQLPAEEALSFDEKSLRQRFLEEACYGETKISGVLAKPLGEILKRGFDPATSTLLGEWAPESMTVPSGSRLPIHYVEGRPPYLEVRIQEIFGWIASPKIARGRVALAFHLLGPNFRPVQVTGDLESFWRTGYGEVRRELRLRYPKHAWPEDPLTAVPEAKGRARAAGKKPK